MSMNEHADIFKIFPNLSTETDIQRIGLENFVLTFPISHGRSSEISNIPLGPLSSSVKTAIRLTRESLYWLRPTVFRPRARSRSLSADVDTQLLLLQLDHGSTPSEASSGRVAAVLPLTEPEYMGTLRGDHDGGSTDGVVARFERDVLHDGEDEEHIRAKIVVSFGSSPRDAIRNVVDAARIAAGTETSYAVLDAERHIFSDTLT